MKQRLLPLMTGWQETGTVNDTAAGRRCPTEKFSLTDTLIAVTNAEPPDS
jgi:hypothetical protein